MNSRKNTAVYALELILGAALIVLSKLLRLESYWLGMGGALIAVGAARLAQRLRYEKDGDYRERFDTEAKDERNAFLRQMAWTWAGSAFVLIGGGLTVLFMILKNDLLMTVFGSVVCLITLLYWIAYLILRKKY